MRKLVLSFMIAAVMATWAATAWAQVTRLDPAKTKNSENFRALFKDVALAAEKATLIVQAVEKEKAVQVSLGTVVAADGYILTKASEVMGREKLTVLVDGKNLDAKVIGVNERHDLAMLKIEAKDLTTVTWAPTKTEKPVVGQWVVSAGPAGSGGEGGNDVPVAVGVVSLERRKILGRNGFLGVAMGETDDKGGGGGAKIEQVISKSAAEQAGLKIDDVVTAVNGKPIKKAADLLEAVHAYRPGDVVALTVKRGEKTLELKATLGSNVTPSANASRFTMMNLMGGPLSRRASDFPAVFQHDTVIRPIDCGGPLVDLNGKVVGVNIARAGRTETYALPADVIEPLIESLKSGKLIPHQ
ncbi:MAG: S1C family serine protease [Phycisphaerales bacterium]|nr:S1C family serine protease [Phycisphaerales bacterium]